MEHYTPLAVTLILTLCMAGVTILVLMYRLLLKTDRKVNEGLKYGKVGLYALTSDTITTGPTRIHPSGE